MFSRWKIKRIIKKLKSMQAHRVHNQPCDAMLKKEIANYFELAALYSQFRSNKKSPYPQLMKEECLRAAAGLDDAQANYQLGCITLDEAKFRDNLEKDSVFKSVVNAQKCQKLYEEAHAYLSVAVGLGHIEAKRLKGLCLINGWGLEIDKKRGFELVVASIEEEGAWDRVPQIFAAIGLNKPEFFSAIMQHKKKHIIEN